MPAQARSLEEFSRFIPANDARLLRQFFRAPGEGPGAGGGFGAMLDRASRMAFGSRTCPTCGGSGWIPRKPRKQTAADLALEALEITARLPPAMDRWCSVCDGRGIVPERGKHRARAPLTARPTGSSIRPWEGRLANESDLADCGRAMTRLRATEALVAGSALALELFYAADSGGVLALWALTPAGRTMLRTNPRQLAPWQLFQNLREAERRKQTDEARSDGEDAHRTRRGALLEAAAAQAQELIDGAHRAWNATAPDASPDATARPKPKHRLRAPRPSVIDDVAALLEFMGAA